MRLYGQEDVKTIGLDDAATQLGLDLNLISLIAIFSFYLVLSQNSIELSCRVDFLVFFPKFSQLPNKIDIFHS